MNCDLFFTLPVLSLSQVPPHFLLLDPDHDHCQRNLRCWISHDVRRHRPVFDGWMRVSPGLSSHYWSLRSVSHVTASKLLKSHTMHGRIEGVKTLILFAWIFHLFRIISGSSQTSHFLRMWRVSPHSLWTFQGTKGDNRWQSQVSTCLWLPISQRRPVRGDNFRKLSFQSLSDSVYQHKTYSKDIFNNNLLANIES